MELLDGRRPYGCAGDLREVARASPSATKNRVELRRQGAAPGEELVEWYVNGPLGLEQGFTVPGAPPCLAPGDQDLVIELALGGAERPDFVVPQNRYNEALAFIKSGLRDVSLSRARPEMGRARAVGRIAGHLRLDRRAAQLLHGARYAREGEDLTERFWPADVHLIGKDILGSTR